MVKKSETVNSEVQDLCTFGGRLASERARLKYSQADIRVRTGVSKTTQVKYEAGETFPDVRYLETLGHMGFDILYLLTGSRSIEAMSDEYQNLIDAYEAADPKLRLAAFAVLASPYMGTSERAMRIPGYFQREVLGNENVRFDTYERDLVEPSEKGKGE